VKAKKNKQNSKGEGEKERKRKKAQNNPSIVTSRTGEKERALGHQVTKKGYQGEAEICHSIKGGGIEASNRPFDNRTGKWRNSHYKKAVGRVTN